MASYGLTIGSGVTITSGITLPSFETDDYFEYTTLLLPGNGTNTAQNNTFQDGSTNNFTITRNGNTTQGTFSPFSQTGWGNYFDGSGDSLTAPSGASISGTGDFTVECWVYPTAVPGSYNIIVANDTSGGLAAFGLNANGTIFMGRSLIGIEGTSSNSITFNSWNHIAISRNSSTVKIFVNGVQGFSGTISTNYNTGTVRIGTDGGGTAFPYTGYISNLRFIQGTAVYTGNFTPSTTPLTAISGTSLLTCQSNRFIDNSTNNFTITVNGNTSVVAFSPFNPTASWSAATYGGSGYFDGSGDYLTAPSNTVFAFGTGAYSVEAWVFLTAFDSASSIVFSAASANDAFNLGVSNDGSVGVSKYGAGGVVTSSAGVVKLNSWAHIAAVRTSTSSNDTRLYVNGSLVGTGTDSNNWTVSSAPIVGGFATFSTYDVIGYISNLRVVKGTAVYTGAFTPPTAPITDAGSTSAASYPSTTNVNTSFASSATSLLLNFTNAGIYDATGKNDLETVGNAQISTTQSKWGGSSISFDGTGDYLTFPASNLFIFGTGDFTIECWFYANSLSSTSVLIECRNNTVGPVIFYDSGALRVNYNSSGGVLITGGSLSTGVWYHIALARSGSSTKLFVNGTQSGSTASDTNNYSNNTLIVGASYLFTQTLNGYIQDLRITKGYARYTANFTAPTAAFPTF